MGAVVIHEVIPPMAKCDVSDRMQERLDEFVKYQLNMACGCRLRTKLSTKFVADETGDTVGWWSMSADCVCFKGDDVARVSISWRDLCAYLLRDIPSSGERARHDRFSAGFLAMVGREL